MHLKCTDVNWFYYILALDIHAANIHDTIAGPNIIKKALKKYPTLETISTDAG